MEKVKNIRVAFYLRVSTDEQAKDGFGLDMQLNGLEEMVAYRAKHHDWIHDKSWVYTDDGYSGAELNRPAYKRMMEDAKSGKFDLIAVWKIDRLSRNLTHLLGTFETLQSYNVGFFSHKENIDFTGPIGKLTFQIFGALAEFERETIKMRTREGKNASARRGNFVINSAPFGYEKYNTTGNITKQIRIIDAEAEWVRRIFAECNNGNTLDGIAHLLNENKVFKGLGSIKKEKNTKWYGTKIREMLEDATYIGNATYESMNEKGEVESIPIPVPAIIHPMTFELAQKSLERISENLNRGGGGITYLLSRLIFDVETERNFIGVKRIKGGHSYRRKGFVLNGIEYPNREIPGKALDEYVWSHIEAILRRPKDLFEAYKKQSLDSKNYDEVLSKRKKADTRINNLEDIAFTIEKNYLEGRTSEAMRDKLIQDNAEERRALEKEIVGLDKQLDAIIQAESTKEALMSFSENLDMNMKNLSDSQKRNLIKILVEKIEVTFDGADQLVKILLRFDPSKAMRKSEETNQKIPLLTDNLSKEESNLTIWWRCRGSNPGPWP